MRRLASPLRRRAVLGTAGLSALVLCLGLGALSVPFIAADPVSPTATTVAETSTVPTTSGLPASSSLPVEATDKAEPPTTGPAEPSATCSRAAAVAAVGVDHAADRGVTQSVAVVDRRTGEVVAAVDAERGYNTESLLKTFTAVYYLTTAADAEVSPSALQTLISESDNALQTELWSADIVPSVAARYGLLQTRTSSYPTSGNWGSDRTTAGDQARFVAAALDDPAVGPSLGPWMSAVTPVAADGFDQYFGLARSAGDRGAKQGWSDPGWEPANLHSVGWVGPFAIAILQTSSTASYATMRTTSTFTATLLAADARCDAPLRQVSQYQAV